MTAKIPPTIIVCDCEGEYNGTAYFTGNRFHDDKGLAKVYRTRESLVAGSEVAAKVMARNHEGAWAEYTLKNMREASPNAKFSEKKTWLPKKGPAKKKWYSRLKFW